MKVVILLGGEGLRFKNSETDKPKFLVEVAGSTILEHIMNQYRKYGFEEFILCVKDNCKEFEHYTNDKGVHLVKTGNKTTTGGRVKLIEPYINESKFLLTYGDGVSDVNIDSLIHFHNNQGKLATLTAIKPKHQYGILEMSDTNIVSDIKEKPMMKEWINGGFFVFEKDVFDLIDPKLPLETGLLRTLSVRKQLVAYKHTGFWKSIDTYKDYTELLEILVEKSSRKSF